MATPDKSPDPQSDAEDTIRRADVISTVILIMVLTAVCLTVVLLSG